MADYRLSEAAQSDLEDIANYTELEFGQQQALLYVEQLKAAAVTAAALPLIGLQYQTRDGRHLRRYSSGRHVLFYVEAGTKIEIRRILHQMMDFDRHL